jgi:hypothetical protein
MARGNFTVRTSQGMAFDAEIRPRMMIQRAKHSFLGGMYGKVLELAGFNNLPLFR